MKEVKDWYQQDEGEKINVSKKSGEPIGQSAWVISGAIILGSLIISTGILCGN